MKIKRITFLALVLGIFAGFIMVPTFAQDLPTGSSELVCRSRYVKLILQDGIRIWEECEKGAKKKDGCRLRFCNNHPAAVVDGTAFWSKEACNKYCVGFQSTLPVGTHDVRSISGESGTDLVLNYVSLVYKFGVSILGLVAILIIVISGVQMIAGGADENNYTTAKDRILQAILSLVMLFSSALILRTINPDFFT